MPEIEGIPTGISFDGFFGQTIEFQIILSAQEFGELWEVLGKIIHTKVKAIREKQ